MSIEYFPYMNRGLLLEVDHDDMTITWWLHSMRVESVNKMVVELALDEFIFVENEWLAKGFRMIGTPMSSLKEVA